MYPLTSELVVDPRAPRTAEWEKIAAYNFRRRMMGRDTFFPCIFGVDALRKATLRFAFISHNRDRPRELAAALRDFVGLAPRLGRRTSLVVFFEEVGAARTLEEYRDQFWALLQSVHDLDIDPWPDDIAMDPDHEKWEFAFAGMPMFVVVNTPAHRHRSSRYSECFMVTFQPRFVFADITEDTPHGKNARTIIRNRLRSYDDVPASPLLGSFGTPGNREWLQYFLDDDNSGGEKGAAMQCPLHIKRKEGRNEPEV
jgi:FPC/CPF motif-containing protein YcgG